MSTPKPNQPLIVVVSGGGPVGLTFSLHLTMMMGKHVKIIIYEGRWFVDEQGKTKWQGEDQGKIRRDQVVTLQDHVIEEMPEYIQKGLFKRFNERVWPTSRNIPIQEVEDRLFELIQPFVQNGQIELVPENLHNQSECLRKGDFDILVGADGAGSFVRTYCNIQMISEGIEYACGVAYNIPDKVSPHQEPLDQALNCILTVSQTRYLVNSSTSRHGYLNIRLIQEEYNELHQRLQNFQSRNEPLDLLDYSKCPQSPVWQIIRQGLEYFKIAPKFVFRVIPIKINVRHASVVVRELRFELDKDEKPVEDHDGKKYKTSLVFLVGDAAMNVHFWLGRGMNSGMKGAMALARNIHRSCTKDDIIAIPTPLRFLDFLDYEGFMARLRAREQQGRSLRVLINPIDKCIEGADASANKSENYDKYKEKLTEKLKHSRGDLQGHPKWPHKSREVTDAELKAASDRITPQAVAQLSLAKPWPTREMGGVEVRVEDTYPYESKNFLPVPTSSNISIIRPPTAIVRHRFVILWIVGDKKIDTIDKLIEDIKNSPKFTPTSTNKEDIHQLIVVQTIEQAKDWIKSNLGLIRQNNIIFKVVTLWTIKDGQSAVHVIQAVRSYLPRVPVLIFTHKYEEAQSALEFPNVMATVMEYEVKEFVGINQETQWNAGCLVSHKSVTELNVDQNEKLSPTGRNPGQTNLSGSPLLPYPSPKDALIPSDLGFPPLPHIGFSSLYTPATSPDLSLDQCSLYNRDLKPMLLWIDSADHEPKTTQAIQKAHPTLEIMFIATFNDADIYLAREFRAIQTREKFITICRGYYSKESKNFVDVARAFDDNSLESKPLAVYTSSRTALLARTPDAPKRVEIFDRDHDLLAFISRHLKN